MPRSLIVVALIAVAGVATWLLWPTPHHQGPTRVAVPDGWKYRLDSESSAVSGDVVLAAEESGVLHARNGPNTVFFREEDKINGQYTVSVDVEHVATLEHSHGAGLLFGGKDLLGSGQRYTYFLIRDGHYLIKTRTGDETTALTPWTRHAAIVGEKNGAATNSIAVTVGPKETVFSVNGKEIDRAATSSLHTDGVYGLRMVHDLEVRFANLAAKPRKL